MKRKSLVESLKQDLTAIKNGKPFKQSIVRRMTVKGKTVFARETFTAPIGRTKEKH